MRRCEKGSALWRSSCMTQKDATLRRCGQCSQLLPSGRVQISVEEGWSELPMDLLGSILEYLHTADRARFRSVCTAWNSAPPPLHHPLETPCLLFSPSVSDTISVTDDEQKSNQKEQTSQRRGPQQMMLYSISDDRTYKLRGHRADAMADCCVIVSYCPSGWLMYADRVSELQCIHLPTGERIHPPSITTTPTVTGVKTDSQGHITGYYIYEGCGGTNLYRCKDLIKYFYHRGIIFFPGSPPDYMPTTEYNHRSTTNSSHGYVIVVAYQSSGKVLFARQGDTSWTLLNVGVPTDLIRSFVLHRRSLYMVQMYGTVIFRIQLNSDLSFGTVNTLPSNVSFLTSEWNQRASTAYLVEIDGHVCLVWRTTDIIAPELEQEPEETDDVEEDDEADDAMEDNEADDAVEDNEADDMEEDDDYYFVPGTCKTLKFQVFTFDESQATWVEKDAIGDYAIFVGNNYSLALSTHDFPHLTRDCIYFTDDDYESYGRPTWWDLGVYNLQDQSISPYFDGLISMGLPQPIWVMPSSFYDS